ncbi:S-formylglutathione hydrolase [Gloeocapsa sp. PCC 73106]|uniref:S-formylglutathione hydrolase n=1 Tax=Gloeocapsa sp. PCC 73106 TaxID=102232 RepID=UPI0002AC5AD9|nr:S-formylglutathione hydrolase [Gloeocapsa sp. PCC 73106]ELR97688.1 S-formylglutathione hydrolase [Gloeocapsa sp. PCC 73106]
MILKTQHRCFGGTVAYYSHYSDYCRSHMSFSIFLPPSQEPRPVLYFLSGLTCTPENFTVKAGVQRYAALYGLVIVAPDTSPRETGIPGESDRTDLGSGASFYLDAVTSPWREHYQMYSYITKELPQVIGENFAVLKDKQGIFGHSMGGHGALIAALKNPGQYLSVSAFAPISAPSLCEWGKRAFTTYLGEDVSLWGNYDASQLVKHNRLSSKILIDQGKADQFYQEQQLLPEVFQEACQEVGQPLELRFHEGYDHSYFMIASFIGEHLQHHIAILDPSTGEQS